MYHFRRFRGVSFFYFFAETNWSKVGHIFRKILTDKKSDKKKEDNCEVFAMAHTICAKFHGLNRKNGVDIRRGMNLVFYVNHILHNIFF